MPPSGGLEPGDLLTVGVLSRHLVCPGANPCAFAVAIVLVFASSVPEVPLERVRQRGIFEVRS
jgi:hypothetical protein